MRVFHAVESDNDGMNTPVITGGGGKVPATVSPAYLDKASLSLEADYAALVLALERALTSDVDPEDDSPRLFSPAPGGEFIIMPSSGRKYSGTKLVTIAPDNPAVGLPKVQGIYVLFNSETLSPVAILDGAELTLLRTPATTALAVKNLLAADPRGRSSFKEKPEIPVLLVFGTGPQASCHINAISAIADVAEVVIVGRSKERETVLAADCAKRGLKTRIGHKEDAYLADVILCVTSARDPLFDDALVRPNTIVAAVGSHGLDAREIDPALARRADVFVEGRSSAMRESGNLIPARSSEEWEQLRPTNLAELVQGEFTRHLGAPALYTAVGMGWEDLVIAAHIHEQHLNRKSAS